MAGTIAALGVVGYAMRMKDELRRRRIVEAVRRDPVVLNAMLDIQARFDRLLADDVLHSMSRTPRTAMAEIERRTLAELGVDERPDFLGTSQFLRVIHDRLGADLTREIIREGLHNAVRATKRSLRQSHPFYSLLLRIVDQVEVRHPFAGTLAFCRVKPLVFGMAAIQPERAIADAFHTPNGEEQAGRIKAAVIEVCEAPYKLYLESLVLLEGLARSRWVTPAQELGTLVPQATAAMRRLGEAFSRLVDPQVAHIRNAAAHKGHEYWIFQPRDGTISIKDRNHTVGDIRCDELLARVADWQSLSASCHHRLVHWYLHKHVALDSGLHEVWIDQVLAVARDDATGARQAQLAEEKIRKMMSDDLLDSGIVDDRQVPE